MAQNLVSITNQNDWRKALDELPATPDNIPAFFFAHGSPILAWEDASSIAGMGTYAGSKGPLAAFLKDFGPALLQKYNPRGIVVFSAHWETHGERLVTDYSDENPLLMDYYGFPSTLYELKFKSRGDAALSCRVVELYKEAGYLARTTTELESRGSDGRGFDGPGLDHGVFIPFRLMFGETFTEVPILQVSIDSTMSPEKNWALGAVIRQLREEGILILSGGLTVHNLRDRSCFSPDTCKPIHKDFDQAILHAVAIPHADARKRALMDLPVHPGFRPCHPREDHFIPLYVAAGAGEAGKVKVVNSLYGNPTFAFGL